MAEIWDIYNEKREKTGKTAIRGVDKLKENEYHIVVTGVIINSKNEILITQRAPSKTFPLMWECNGGSIVSGEDSLSGVIRELKEDVGIEIDPEDGILIKSLRRAEVPPDFKDVWVFRKDIKDEEITLPDGEAVDFKWVTIDEFMNMYKNNLIVPTVDFFKDDYEKVIGLI